MLSDSVRMAHLFDPLMIRDVAFANRVFVSPMCQYSRISEQVSERLLSKLSDLAVRWGLAA